MRILIADDHEAVRKGVCFILSSRPDLEICAEAKNGQEALDLAREIKPDLIILDITMPVMDGMTAAREIKRFLPEVPILMFSMHNSPAAIREAQLLGVQGFLTKSQAAGMLLKAIDALADNKTFFENQCIEVEHTA
jgi:DNA-binding NarL/FixJ family response regulator